MNYCPNCGNAITDGDLFCSKCGLKVFSNSSTPDINSTNYNVGGLRYPRTIIATLFTFGFQQLFDEVRSYDPVFFGITLYVLALIIHVITFSVFSVEYEKNNKVITTATIVWLIINIILVLISYYYFINFYTTYTNRN